jgi:plastocyanin
MAEARKTEGRTIEVRVFVKARRCLVRPADAFVQVGDTIRWLNLTGRALEFLLPAGMPLVGHAPRPVGGGRSGTRQDYEVQITADAPAGAHAYAVFSSAANAFGEGESSPHVIVEE